MKVPITYYKDFENLFFPKSHSKIIQSDDTTCRFKRLDIPASNKEDKLLLIKQLISILSLLP